MTKASVRIYLFEDFIKQNIDILELNERSKNCLKRGAINTIEDLIEHHDQLPHMRNCGTTTITNVDTKLFDCYVQYMEKYHPDMIDNVVIA